MKSLQLHMHGELWVSYPLGMRFPKVFKKWYPFRGRGIVSRFLYWINWLGADRILLKDSECGESDIAWFWPSPKRSSGRYYGYRVRDGHVAAYVKIATTDAECEMLRREVKNIKTLDGIGITSFKYPRVVSCADANGVVRVEFSPLPEDVVNIKNDGTWLDRINSARAELNGRGLFHGDFLPHNVKCNGRDLWIIDWEEMSDDYPALVDEISFKTAFSYFCEKKSKEQVFAEFLSDFCNNDSRKKMAVEALQSLKSRKIGLGAILLDELFQGGEDVDSI